MQRLLIIACKCLLSVNIKNIKTTQCYIKKWRKEKKIKHFKKSRYWLTSKYCVNSSFLFCQQLQKPVYIFNPSVCPLPFSWIHHVFFLSERRILQAQTEKEGIESDLSSMFPKVGQSSRLKLIIHLWPDNVCLS